MSEDIPEILLMFEDLGFLGEWNMVGIFCLLWRKPGGGGVGDQRRHGARKCSGGAGTWRVLFL